MNGKGSVGGNDGGSSKTTVSPEAKKFLSQDGLHGSGAQASDNF